MEKIYSGKTKDLFMMEDGKILFKFKDDITGTEGTADPGGNEVVGSIKGLAEKNLAVTKYFFELMGKNDIPTHFVSADLKERTMIVKKAKFFGHGLEVITRYKAVGSFVRRYGLYVEDGSDLDAYVEITLKDDERKDPLITKDGLLVLNILKDGEYEEIMDLNSRCTAIIKKELEINNLNLYDIKLEFGRVDEKIVLIDEISGGNMRVYREGVYIEPEDLINHILDIKR